MMPDAWDYTTGSSAVTVGIIDSGIDGTHPDLDERVNAELSRSFCGVTGPLVDENGHGTAIAGIIGAEANNQDESENAMVGVCWNVQLVSLKIAGVDENGNKLGIDSQAVADAILYATEKEIDVLNFSAGGEYDPHIPAIYAAIRNYDGLFVCAAGNDGLNNDVNPFYPSQFDLTNLISVTASDCNDMYTDTNFGANTVDIYAPGVDIYTTKVRGFRIVEGPATSVAAPYVTGVAALMLSYNPNLSAAQIKAIIMHTADPAYQNDVNVLEGKCVSGGRLNAYAALYYVASHLEYHDSFVVTNGSGDATIEHAWVCSCGDILEQRHGYSEETNVESPTYHRLTCICGEWAGEREAHEIESENVGSVAYHRLTCSKCAYTSDVSHTWELVYMNPDDISTVCLVPIGSEPISPQAVVVYRCTVCGYVSYTTPPDYGYN